MSMYPQEIGTIPAETRRSALDDLAQFAPEWLIGQITADWFERYSHQVENYRLPKAENQRMALAEQIGADGVHLFAALEQADAPLGLKELESVQVLRQVWQQYYDLSKGRATWRTGHKLMNRRACCVLPMIQRPAPAKSGKPSGCATKCI